MKVCKDCKFYCKWVYIYPSSCSKFTRKDPVEGHTINIYTCTGARDVDGLCGPDAVFFEPKLTPPPKPWYRL